MLFRPFEQQVLSILLGPSFGAELVRQVTEDCELVSLEYSGAGYFLTVKHADLPLERSVYNRPIVTGELNDGSQATFLAFVEEGTLTLECATLESTSLTDGFRDRDVRISTVADRRAE